MPDIGRPEDLKLTFAQRIGRILEHPWFVPAVAGLGLLCRLALLLILLRHRVVFLDELDYDDIALSIWKTHRFVMASAESAFRAPGEPIFIAAVYSILGYLPNLILFLHIILLTAEPFLCAALGRRIGLSVRAANVAALLASFHPGLAYSATTLYPTALTSLALTAGLLYSSIAAEDNDKAESVKGGLALGLAGSFTTTFVPLPLLAAIYCIWKRKLRAAVIIGILGMLPAVIWVVRNGVVMGEYTIASNGGLNLYLGANDGATPFSGNKVYLPPNDPGIEGRDELGQDHMWKARAAAWIHIHPVRYAWLCVQRGFLVVDSVGKPKTQGLHTGLGPKLIAWTMFPVTVLGLAGLVIKRRRAASVFTAAAFLLVAASSAFTIVKPRFRFPCDPALSVFAMAAVSGIVHLARKEPAHPDEDSPPA